MRNILKNQNIIFLFFISAIVVLVITILSGQMMYRSAEMIEETSAQEMLALSRAAALLTTADELDEYMVPADMDKPGYEALKDKLVVFTEQAGLEYTYYMRLDTETNMMQFIIDNTSMDEATGLIEPQVPREDSPDLALQGEANTVPLGSYSDGWEGYLTAFAPVYYSDGTPSNMVAGVDLKDVYIYEARNNIIILMVVLCVSLVVVLGTCLLCLLLYRKKVRQAELANVSKSAFLSNMSHEMRTPMNAIIGMAEIAKGSDDPDRIKYCLSKIDDAAVHLLGVINDVLDISKIEAGKFALSYSEFTLDSMLQRVTTVVNFKVDEKKQNFIIKVDRNVPESIITDQQRLSQVVTNLLSNAVKFTPEEGRICLFIHKDDEVNDEITLRFEVVDNGIGIAKEKQEKLFSSFVQADNTISRRFGGTGLGLAISKSIVETMDGNIWVESVLGEGSTFTFTVKVKRGTDEDILLLPNRVNWKDLRLLIVDDAPEVREYFGDTADKLGVAYDAAASGEEALELMSKGNKYQFLFADYMMPDMDGIEFTKKVKESSGDNAVVVMISATQWSQIEEEARVAGVDDYLAKPLFPSAIVDCINKRMQRESFEMRPFEQQQADSAGIFEGKRILLAEDMEINREIIIALLSSTGAVIDSAENGRVALEMFEKEPDRYDLILMDIHMPEMDGYLATEAIRNLPFEKAKTVPILAMTANVFREDIERCLSVGMNDHIGKPINIIEVVEKIKRYI